MRPKTVWPFISILVIALALLVRPSVTQADKGATIDEKINSAFAISDDHSVSFEMSQGEIGEFLASRGLSDLEIKSIMARPIDTINAANQESQDGEAPSAMEAVAEQAIGYCCLNGIEALYFGGLGQVRADYIGWGGGSISAQFATCSSGQGYCGYYHAYNVQNTCYQSHRITANNPLGWYYLQCMP